MGGWMDGDVHHNIPRHPSSGAAREPAATGQARAARGRLQRGRRAARRRHGSPRGQVEAGRRVQAEQPGVM
eukprot:scaffold113303_cov63-Phaeocystis_antarctica.AAC.2